MDNDAQNKTADKKKKRTLLQRIVNAFLYTGIGFLVLILIFFGISQTHTFREFLREKIIEAANNTVNGKIYIGEIEGTIFTSLTLRNTVVNMESDTLLKAETISILTSPLQLLLKKIYVRGFEIKNATFNLSTDSSGTLNLTKLFPVPEPDTSTSEFPFKIQIANLELSNINFSYRNFENKLVSKTNTGIDYNNILIKNLNLELSAEMDISNNSYGLNLYRLSFLPNIPGFNLKNLRGEFVINEKNILVRNFEIQTDRSDFNAGIVLNNYNIFDSLATNFNEADITFLANSRSFSFDDIKVFLPSLNMLEGNFGFDINVSGSPGDLDIHHIQVLLQNSNIEGKGSLKNLDNPGTLFIYADLDKSFIEQADIKKLLPSLETPLYPELGVIRFDTLKYEGSPLKFNTNVSITTDKGSFTGLINLDLQKALMEYESTFSVSKLDLKPFAGISSSINLSGKIKGKGDTPANFDGSLNLKADGSTLNGNVLDTLKLTANAENKNISYNFYLVSKKTEAGLNGNIDFTNEENPAYKIAGDIRNLDVAEFSGDSLLHTDLNFTFDGEGESFDQDKMNLFMSMKLFDSKLADVNIDSVRAIIDLQGGAGQERVINIISDIADITMTGNFKLTDAITLMTNEAGLLSTVYTDKLQKLFPSASHEEGIDPDEKTGSNIRDSAFSKIDSQMSIDYAIELKDFNLISAFIGQHLEVDAEMGGKIVNDDNGIHLNFKTDVNYIKLWNDESAFFVTEMNLNLDVLNDFYMSSTSDVEVDLDVSADRIFTGKDIYDFHFDLKMKNDKAYINFGAKQEPLIAQIHAGVDISNNMLDVSIDSLKFSKDQFLIVNNGPLNFTYTQDRIDIKKFDIVHNAAHLKANGFLSRSGNQKLSVDLSGLRGNDLSIDLLHLRPENSLDANISLALDVSGNMAEPVINLDMSVDSVKYGGRTFGLLKCKANYKNKNLDLDITFLDSLLNPTSSALAITGYIPVDLSLESSSDYVESRPMNIRVKSDGFNLGAFGDILPVVNRLRGNLTSDLRLTGLLSSLKVQGYLKIKDAAFFLEANNLEYNASADIKIEGNRLTIDSLMIANVAGTLNGGKLTGSGVALFDNFTATSSKLSIKGDLKILDNASKSASPSVYGSLVIGTDGTMELEGGRIFIQAPVVIKDANLTFPQTQSAYQSSSENYVYHFVEDTVKRINEKMDFERLVEITQKQDNEKDNSLSKKNIFDYDLKVSIEDEATVIFVLSKEFNQNLKAVLDGSIRLEKYGSKTEAQGQLRLLEGSTLEFLKTLEAEGSIKFESDITNPNLDIVATYKDYYYPAEGTDAGKEVEVAVKIEVKGPLQELDKKLISNENNINVYYGADNIEKNNPSPQYDASDAAMFILLGKFNNDATQQDRNAVASTATGLAGSLVGGFLNRQFGDVIKSVELRQVGSATKISLIGRAGSFRYEIGTSTDVYQDLSRANIKIEYPVLRRLLLRLERKESISTETTYSNEMINELGLKYRFEF